MVNKSSSEYIQATEICYDGFFKMLKHQVQYPKFDGSLSKLHNRELLVREATVAIILHDAKLNAILLTEQFRVGPLHNGRHPWLYEVPAGIVEEGEDKTEAIKREVIEETGYQCDSLETVGDFYLSPGGSNEVTTLFYSPINLDKSGFHGALGENEDIKTHIVPVEKALQLFTTGQLSAITGLAIMWLQANQNN